MRMFKKVILINELFNIETYQKTRWMEFLNELINQLRTTRITPVKFIFEIPEITI